MQFPSLHLRHQHSNFLLISLHLQHVKLTKPFAWFMIPLQSNLSEKLTLLTISSHSLIFPFPGYAYVYSSKLYLIKSLYNYLHTLYIGSKIFQRTSKYLKKLWTGDHYRPDPIFVQGRYRLQYIYAGCLYCKRIRPYTKTECILHYIQQTLAILPTSGSVWQCSVRQVVVN